MKIFITISLIFLLFNAKAQVTKFNRSYLDTVPTLRNILVTDTGYIGLGGCFYDRVYVIISFFDTSGNIIKTKKIKNPDYTIFHGYENSLIKAEDNGYFLAGSRVLAGTQVKEGYILRFNQNFDTLWTRHFFTDTLYVSFYGCMRNNKNYFVVGEKGFINDDSGVLLVKTDSVGNMLWSKTYGGVNMDYGTKVIKTYDNKFLIGGYTKSYQIGPSQYYGAWYLIKVDTAGVKQWQALYGNSNFNDGWIRALINTSDSCYAIGGSIATEFDIYQTHFLKLDKNSNVLIDRSYLTPSSGTVLYSIVELNNSHYISLGTEAIDLTKYGFLMKLSPQGNIVWKRNYNASGNAGSTNYAYAVSKTPDNGFAFTGCSWSSPDPQMYWLVKTDSLGCDGVHSCDDTTMFVSTAYLQDSVCFGDSVHITINFGGRSAPYTLQSTTGFAEDSIYYFDSGSDTISRTFSVLPQQENTYYNFTATITDPWGVTKTGQFSFYVKHCSTSVSLNDQDLLKFQVYPNPAKDNITISCSENIPATIFLLNIHGEILQQTTLQNQTTIFNVKNFADGIYVVKIVFVNGIVIKKVIKE